METLELSKRPSKSEQRIAEKSHVTLSQILEHVHSPMTEIEIEETKEKLQIPSRALELLNEILKAMSQGNPISIVPVATEVTTQKAAEILGCSRPHLVKLLENGELDFIRAENDFNIAKTNLLRVIGINPIENIEIDYQSIKSEINDNDIGIELSIV